MVKKWGLKKASLYDHFEGLTTDSYLAKQNPWGRLDIKKGFFNPVLMRKHDFWHVQWFLNGQKWGVKKKHLYVHFEGLTTDYFGSQITTRGTVSKGYYTGTYRNCHILAALHNLCSNEAPVILEGLETTALIDLATQVSSVSTKFCEDLALHIQPLGQTGDAAIPYLWFMEVNLHIPGIRNYNKDVLLLVIPTTTYSEMVLVMVGSKIID